MKDKCYTCGSSEYMANNCSVAKDIKCKKCSMIGHTQTACIGLGQARATDDGLANNQVNSNNASLALEYQPDSAQANYTVAFSGAWDHHSFPIFPALL